MIDSKNGGSLVYSNVCGLMVYRYMIKRLASKSNMPMSNAYTGDIPYIVMVYRYMIKRLELIGNGKLWMVLLQRHLLGEKGTGANPTARDKSGIKRSMVVDGKGVPLGITVDANMEGF